MSSPVDDIEAVLTVVRRAIRIDEIETQQRIDFEAAGGDDWQTINTRHWERHEQRCAGLKLEERRLLDVLAQHHSYSPMMSVTVDTNGDLICIP